MLSGTEADKAAIADGDIPAGEHVPNDYYIRNKNPKLRTFEVAFNAKITMKTYKANGGLKPKTITFSELKALYSKNDEEAKMFKKYVPYWIELKGSTITSIEELFIP